MTASKEENQVLLDNLTPAIAVARRSTGIRTQNGFTKHGRRRSLSHLAILTGILLPLAIVPYVLARRHIFSLRQRVGEMESKIISLERQLDKAVTEASSTRHEQVRMRGLLHEMMQEADEMRQESSQRTMKQAQTNQAVQADLLKLLNETQHMRKHRKATLSALGMSLADVAAFMHEMEMRMGLQSYGTEKDDRGIHRLRFLALQMQMQEQSQRNEAEDKSVVK